MTTGSVVPTAIGGLVLIGASLGGPTSLESVLRNLPPGLPIAVVIAQHMPEGKTAPLAAHLSERTGHRVREAADGQHLHEGDVLLCPGGHNIEIRRVAEQVRTRVRLAPQDQVFVPAIDQLFTTGSAALGDRVVGVILTGLGNDGTVGLQAIRDGGGFTIAESHHTAAVFGMPRHAIESGAATSVLAREEVGPSVAACVRAWPPHSKP